MAQKAPVKEVMFLGIRWKVEGVNIKFDFAGKTWVITEKIQDNIARMATSWIGAWTIVILATVWIYCSGRFCEIKNSIDGKSRLLPKYYQWMKNTGWHWFTHCRTFHGILQQTYKIRQRRKTTQAWFPVIINLFLTSCCDENCPDCPKKQLTDTMAYNDWLKIGREAIQHGCMALFPLGGEPLIDREKIEMVKRLKRALGFKMFFVVFTAGGVLDEQDVKDFNRLGIALAINVHSGRKKDDKAWRVMEMAKKHKALVVASITVTRNNYRYVTSWECMEHLRRHGCSSAIVIHYLPCGKPETDNKLALDRATFMEIEKILHTTNYPIAVHSYVGCYAGRAELSIESDGRISACFWFTGSKSLGDVRSTTIFQVFNSTAAKEIRRINSNRSCLLFGQPDWLKEQGYITPEMHQGVVDSSMMPPDYRREILGEKHRIVTFLQALVWGYMSGEVRMPD